MKDLKMYSYNHSVRFAVDVFTPKAITHIDVFGLLRETREMPQGDQEDAKL